MFATPTLTSLCRSNFVQVGSSEISLLPPQPLESHVIGYSSTPNLSMFNAYQQPPHNYPCYPRPYSQGNPLSISTRSLPPSDWTPIHSGCDSPVDPFQSAAVMAGPQPYGPLYSAQMSRSWTALNERSPAGINNYVEKEHSTLSAPIMAAAIGPRQSVPTEGALPFNVVGLQSPLPQASTAKRQLPMPSSVVRQMAAPLHAEAFQVHPTNANSQVGREPNVALYSSGSWTVEHYPTDCPANSLGSGASISQIEAMPTTASTTPANAAETSPRSCTDPISSIAPSPTTMTTSSTMSSTSPMTSLMDDAAPASVSSSSVITQASTIGYMGNYSTRSSEDAMHRNGSVSNLFGYQFSADKTRFSW